MPWYCKTQRGEIGPISSAELKELAQSGRVKPDTLVKNNPESEWSPASKVKGLFALAEIPKLPATIEPPKPQAVMPRVVQSEPQKACPFCGESIAIAAVKCKHCGEFLDESKRQQPAITPAINVVQQQAPQPIQTVIHMSSQPQPRWSPGVAAVLSFLIPGLGQIYKGQIFNGIAWLVMTIIGYVLFIIPGVVLHLCCIIGAASGNPNK
jgi:predicted nucleic acid-binding Zn ribbon protein